MNIPRFIVGVLWFVCGILLVAENALLLGLLYPYMFVGRFEGSFIFAQVGVIAGNIVFVVASIVLLAEARFKTRKRLPPVAYHATSILVSISGLLLVAGSAIFACIVKFFHYIALLSSIGLWASLCFFFGGLVLLYCYKLTDLLSLPRASGIAFGTLFLVQSLIILVSYDSLMSLIQYENLIYMYGLLFASNVLQAIAGVVLIVGFLTARRYRRRRRFFPARRKYGR